jgi:hypothetical protein
MNGYALFAVCYDGDAHPEWQKPELTWLWSSS